ncbi:MrcB family domain-containing protein [Agrobacterium tumefaciens]|uniref:MrcB family domain-containing protein n=1 Tax=Agrobacterium tumefaciens TaxID=358 RepID=UPI001572A321|nr:DUF3578 domain-containing protein [Agrobacterium tumefaciens]MEA1844974.1 DUF3578 domain-containing protein [Agrobacterium tumefaciens]WCK20062.1 DUF3578 domain-containing protein [Agrobacterium tumefaciens]
MMDIVGRIIELQSEWSANNTPAMQERGQLVRDTLPTSLRRLIPQISAVLDVAQDDVGIVGRDGSGRKTAIPWIRIFSRDRSPDPRNGWYLVLLFHSEGQKLYLCLSHGSTDWTGGEFKPKPASEIAPLMHWASSLVEPFLFKRNDLVSKIDLGKRGKLGRPYEASTPVAKLFDINSLPSDAGFEEDILLFASMLKIIYDKEDLGRTPTAAENAFQTAQQDLKASIEGRKVKGGQGFGLTLAERKAVEEHAMKVAEQHLASKGYACEITSSYAPYDIIASKDEGQEEFIVEVKGTTSEGSHVFLTANEVDVHRARKPDNALYLVHSIDLIRQTPNTPPQASGGVLVIAKPWDVDACELRAVSYQVKL